MTTPQTTVDRLNQLLADFVVLSQMTHTAHWNVKGPTFFGLHKFFETLYRDLEEPIDEIAERIRVLDSFPHSTLSQYLKTTIMSEIDTAVTGEKQLLEDLEKAYTDISAELASFIDAEDADPVTQDLYVGYKALFDKRLWMIRSFKK